MQITHIQNNNPYFGIKVSDNFIRMAHNQYHFNNVPNKRSLIWQFNNKVEHYSNFGHDDFTIDYERKFQNGNWEHYLFAVRDDGLKINIFHRSTFAKIVDRFLQMKKHELDTKFRI